MFCGECQFVLPVTLLGPGVHMQGHHMLVYSAAVSVPSRYGGTVVTLLYWPYAKRNKKCTSNKSLVLRRLITGY